MKKFTLIGFMAVVAIVAVCMVPGSALAVDETNYTASAIGYTNDVTTPAIVAAQEGNFGWRAVVVTAPAGAELVWKAGSTLLSNEVALCGGVIPRATSQRLALPDTYRGAVAIKCLTNEAAVTGVKIKDIRN